MKEEVERQQSVRRCLELEVHALTRRMSTVENAAENLIAEYSTVEGEKRQIPRSDRFFDNQVITQDQKYLIINTQRILKTQAIG